jgi:hypothetical protein
MRRSQVLQLKSLINELINYKVTGNHCPTTIFAIILWDNLVLGMLYRQYAFYADIYRPLPPPTRFNVASMPEDVSFVIYYFFMAATLNRGHGGNWTLAVLRRFTICPIVSGKDCL